MTDQGTSFSIHDLVCPGCGGPQEPSSRSCRFCGRAVVVSTFSSVKDMTPQQLRPYLKAYDHAAAQTDVPEVSLALGICHLKLRLYDTALRHLEDAIDKNIDNPETMLYAAVALLAGRKAGSTPMPEIKKALSFIDAARRIENRGVFDYFAAYIKHDFYQRKFLQISPNWSQELAAAEAHNMTHADIELLHELLGQRPTW